MKRAFYVLLAFFLAPAILRAHSKIAVTSLAFASSGEIPANFTCAGQGSNPPLKIGGTPANAKTLVLIVDDPDAPSGLFTHWLVWNIDAKTSEVAANSVPAGSVEGTNDFAKRGYGAPCPPSKTHRYFFRVFALDRTLDLKAGAPRHELNAAMQGHIIAQGELMGRCTHR